MRRHHCRHCGSPPASNPPPPFAPGKAHFVAHLAHDGAGHLFCAECADCAAELSTAAGKLKVSRVCRGCHAALDGSTRPPSARPAPTQTASPVRRTCPGATPLVSAVLHEARSTHLQVMGWGADKRCDGGATRGMGIRAMCCTSHRPQPRAQAWLGTPSYTHPRLYAPPPIRTPSYTIPPPPALPHRTPMIGSVWLAGDSAGAATASAFALASLPSKHAVSRQLCCRHY
jgi:hypothetical protein